MNYNLTSKDIQSEETVKALLSPVTDPTLIIALGNTYDPEELRGSFVVDNNNKKNLSIIFKPNSEKPWVVSGVISNIKTYKSFTGVKKYLEKCV